MENSQNNPLLTLSTQNIACFTKSKHPVKNIVFSLVSTDGNVLYHLSHSLKLDRKVYIMWLEEVVLTWIETGATERFYV